MIAPCCHAFAQGQALRSKILGMAFALGERACELLFFVL